METSTLNKLTVGDKMKWRKNVVLAAIQKQESIIRDFKLRIADLLSNDGNVNEEEYDNHLQSFKSEAIAEVNSLNNEMQFANKELEQLRKIEWNEYNIHDRVHFGTIVHTDQKIFFVSASLEEFTVDGTDVFGISVRAPLYTVMKEKKVGDSYSFNGTRYQIQDIC